MAGEIDKLLKKARFQRNDALGEIASQKDEFLSYFMGILNASPSSHPWTYKLLHIANLFGGFVGMYWKGQYNRRRPSQLEPKLLPPFSVPGHASYPSGHATQAHLVAMCAALAANKDPSSTSDRLVVDLRALAARIALNREIAGFHYESDTTAGRDLACRIFGFIEDDRACDDRAIIQGYRHAVRCAQWEWSHPDSCSGEAQ